MSKSTKDTKKGVEDTTKKEEPVVNEKIEKMVEEMEDTINILFKTLQPKGEGYAAEATAEFMKEYKPGVNKLKKIIHELETQPSAMKDLPNVKNALDGFTKHFTNPKRLAKQSIVVVNKLQDAISTFKAAAVYHQNVVLERPGAAPLRPSVPPTSKVPKEDAVELTENFRKAIEGLAKGIRTTKETREKQEEEGQTISNSVIKQGNQELEKQFHEIETILDTLCSKTKDDKSKDEWQNQVEDLKLDLQKLSGFEWDETWDNTKKTGPKP